MIRVSCPELGDSWFPQALITEYRNNQSNCLLSIHGLRDGQGSVTKASFFNSIQFQIS